MNFLSRVFRCVWYTGWYTLAILVVLAAVTLSVARLLLPVTDNYNNEIEARLSTLLGQPVKIGGLDAEWQGFGPRLILKDVRLLEQPNGKVIARFDKARLRFDILSYLRHGQLGLSNISVTDISLYIDRHPDGRISLAGIDTMVPGGESGTESGFEQWISEQVQLDIENATVYWRDSIADKMLHFTNVNLHLRNQGNRHQLDGAVKLPKDLGGNISFALDVSGNPLRPTGWDGGLYIKGQKVKVSEIMSGALVAGVRLDSDTSDFELWSQWHDRELLKLKGAIDTHNLRLVSAHEQGKPKTLTISKLGGKLLWLRQGNGWKLDIDRFNLTRAQQQWPDTRIHLTSNRLLPWQNADIEANIGFLRIDDVRAVLLLIPNLNPELHELLLRLRPTGELRNISATLQNDTKQYNKYFLQTEFNHVSYQAWKTIPGVSNLSGDLYANETSGHLAFNSSSAQFNMPHLFRDVLSINQLAGRINWKFQSNAWHVATSDLIINNDDIKTRTAFNLEFPANGESPFIDLVLACNNGNGKHFSRYLPAKIMKPKTVQWLDRSILGGHILDGKLLFHGRLKDFPFKQGQGKFESKIHIVDGLLDYAPQWPLIKNIDANLMFSGRRMQVTGNTGKIFDSKILAADISIDDMAVKPPLLKITGKISGPTDDQLNYLRASPPLKEHFGESLSGLAMDGDSVLNLDLAIPLKDEMEGQVKVKGKVDIKNNTLSIEQGGGLLWKDLNGTMIFTDDGIEAKGLKGQFFSQPSILDITTKQVGKDKIAKFQAHGKLKPADLALDFAPAWSQYFEGLMDWYINVDVPIHSKHRASKPLIHVKSVLDDVEIKLPAPLNKPAGKKLVVEADAELAKRERTIYVNYGDILSTALQFALINNKLALKRGEAVLGGGTAALPAYPGLHISGRVNQISYDQWKSVIDSTLPVNKRLTDNNLIADPLNNLTSVDIQAGTFEALGQTYSAVQLNAMKLESEWEIKINSDNLAGSIEFPLDFKTTPLVMDLERWHLLPFKNNGNRIKTIDPGNLPAIKINCKEFVYNDIKFGSFTVNSSRTFNGLKLDNMELETPITNITGKGLWQVTQNQQHSNFDFKLTTKNIGETMSALGYAGTIKGGKGDIAIKLAWPASPIEVTPKILDGSVNINFKNGQLLEMDPGAGRIFGLLSLQTLPRRLTLDFSDMFAKGFSFDEIKGDFRIEGGDAYTHDLHLSGPAARIAVLGRVGLTDKDYDQLVTVIPDITASVPLLTLLLSYSEPTTALVTWVLKNIFQSQIDQAVSFQYTITGDWQNPKIEKVVRPRTQFYEDPMDKF